MNITGYFYEPTTKVLYLFRNNEQEHFDTRPDVESEEHAIEIVNEMNNPKPVVPTPSPVLTPTPLPTPTPSKPITEESFSSKEFDNDLPPLVAEEVSNRDEERRHQLSSLGMVFNPERGIWTGNGFEVSEAIIRNHLPEYWNALIQGIQNEVNQPTIAPGEEHILSPVDANMNADGSPLEEETQEIETLEEVEETETQEEVQETKIPGEAEETKIPEEPEETEIPKEAEVKKEEVLTYDKVSTDIKKIDAKTNFFSICAQHLIEFKMDMTIDNLGNLVCVLTPKINCKDKAFEKLPPISISGSAEELDINFFSAVLQPILKAQAFATNADSYIDALEKAEAKTKAAQAEAKKSEKTATAKKPRATKASSKTEEQAPVAQQPTLI